jgi:beta-galactosidase GanA
MTDRLLRQHWIITFAAVCVFVCPICVAQPSSLPHLRKQGEATQLIVEGKPFLVLGGELGNSSSSSLEYMRPVWPKLVALNLNTVLVPVYWDLIEPAEGKFDFTLVDGLIQEARKYGLRLMPLWFASWKNSMSCYAPAWVKINQQRFPRAEDRAGSGMEILSPFSSVPQELTSCLERRRDALAPELRAVWAATNFKTRGTWEEVFGPDVSTDEIFMAWHFARYSNRVAELGKAEYALPMFVNAALIRPGHQPGQYSSGGPLPHLMDVWRAGAPQIDFLSPDIYFPNFAEWCRKYHRSGNPLFIPEAILGPLSAVNVFYAVGQHDAIGFVGVLSAQEGKYVEGQWRPGRWLNGDQTHQGRHLRLSPGKFDIQRVKLYRNR